MFGDLNLGERLLDASTARRMLAGAMVAIGRSADPEATFKKLEDVIFLAVRVLGPAHPSVRSLRSMGIHI